jgi:hypothetical protein
MSMAGIPGELMSPMRKALLDCDEFQDQRQLRSLFDESKLIAFKYNLPEADNIGQRVDLAISYLYNKNLRSGENALVLLLQILSERKSAEELGVRLSRLAGQLQWFDHIDPNSPKFMKEANPDREPMLQVLELEQMYLCARAVAHIGIPRFFAGSQQGDFSGTAWMIAPDMAITCYHVLRSRTSFETLDPEDFQLQIENALLTFDFLSSGRGTQYKIDKSEYFNEDLDFAVLRVRDRDSAALKEWGFLQIEELDAPLSANSNLFILQHPRGEQKQGAFGNYVRQSVDEIGTIFYRTPTEPGTSGAPVLNRQNWRVIAIHNGEDLGENLRKGVLINTITSDLQHNKPDLYREINQAQDRKE